jgi:hypothetical protein
VHEQTPQIIAKAGNSDLIKLLIEYGVEFIITGGAAVAVHGCRDPMDVDDLDILIEPTLENARRVMAALQARHINTNFPVDRLTGPEAQICLKMLHYWADLITPRSNVDFGDLVRSSLVATHDWQTVRVIGRADLIAMKEVALIRTVDRPDRHQRHEKDLQCLRAA